MKISKLIKGLVSKKAIGANYNNNSIRFSMQIKILLILISIASSSVIFTLHFDSSPLSIRQNAIQINTPWQNNTLKSDITFPIFKSKEEYDIQVFQAQAEAFPVFDYLQEQNKKVKNQLDKIFNLLKTADANIKFLGDYEINNRLLNIFIEYPEKARKEEIEKMLNVLPGFLQKIYSNGYVNINESKISTNEIIVEVSQVNRNYLKKKFLTTPNNIEEKIINFVKINFLENSEPLFIDIIKNILKPNLFYNSSLTDKEKELAKQNVPSYQGYMKVGDVIVEKGQLITREIKQRIDSYFESKKLRSESYLTPSYILGNIGQSIILYTLLIIYLSILRKKIFYDNLQLTIILSCLICAGVFSWLSIEISSSFPLAYLVPIPALVMLISILYDSRTAFYITVICSIQLALTRGNDMPLAITYMFAGLLAAFTVRDIQDRTQMFQSIFYIFLGFVISIFIFDVQTANDFSYTSIKVLYAMINASLSPILTFGLLFVIEHTTHISTDLRIKEFDNINHPILKKMNEIAPGTYQHTMNVSLLAERCAIEIGANPLLARVGGYFHDIGKIAKPEYFTENQANLDNKLEILSPRKAVEVIKKHVSEGIELAKQYKLPERVIDFIPMHHGTSIIKHFYAKALEEAPQGELVKESDFRYPGPKPNSKEAAILMICDSSEAISKVEGLDNSQIQEFIRKNINEKFLDGQFNECDLSFNELIIIENTILKNLLGFHQRTKYKEIPNEKHSS